MRFSRSTTRSLGIGAAGLAAVVLWTGAPGALAGGDAETKVTIKGGGEVFGYVKSDKLRRCAKDRKVTVFKQKGGEQGGGDDIKVGSDDAGERVGDRYMWSIGNPGTTGQIYAKVRRIEGCKGDTSPTVPAR